MNRNEYDYDDAEDGMQDAVERARLAYNTAADGNPVKYDPNDQMMPPEPLDLPPDRPSMDFTNNEEALNLTTGPTGDARAAAPAPSPFKEPAPNDEYTAALRKIKERLSQPRPDHAKEYGKALANDRSRNRTSQIMDLLAAGMRRSANVDYSPLTNSAAGVLTKQRIQQQGDNSELSALGMLARAAKPAKGSGAGGGNTEAVRSYLVKVGAGTPEELAGMNDKQLGQVMQAYGLKHRIDREPVEDEQKRRAHEDSVRHTRFLEAMATRGEGRLPAGEAAKLGGSDAALKAIDELSSEWDSKASSTGSGLMQYVPGSDANLYMPSLKTTTQVIGTFLEGGKLTDADVPKYAAMMPQPSDTKAVKEAKVAALKRLISEKRASEGQALQGSGYRVPGGGGMVRMSNGRETLLVQPADVSAAEAEGFKRVGG